MQTVNDAADHVNGPTPGRFEAQAGRNGPAPHVNRPQSPETVGGSQYLTFICAGEEYGIDILRVQEIKGWSGSTRVPHAHHSLLGVMNLRGAIVPVIDLRVRFGLSQRPSDASTVVVVVRVRSTSGEKTVGMVVDAVSDVYTFAPDAIRPPPKMGGRMDNACVSGLGSAGNRMVMLLDIDKLTAGLLDAE
jgi:purine-binding chemotaxis protein CheW